MFQVDIDLNSFFEKFKRIYSAIYRGENKAMNSANEFLEEEIESYIDSEGDGSWAPRSNFAKIYTSWPKKKKGRNRFVHKRGGAGGPGNFADSGMLFLMRYFEVQRLDSFPNIDYEIGFRGSKNKKINHLISQVQTGKDIKVSSAMRGAFSVTSQPLKKEKTHIEIPARDVNPAFPMAEKDMYKKFKDEFWRELKGVFDG